MTRQPHQVRYLLENLRVQLQGSARRELVRNAKQPFAKRYTPESIRRYWRSRYAVSFDAQRRAWLIFDNQHEGVGTLLYRPKQDAWTWIQDGATFEDRVRHEDVVPLALHLYRLTIATSAYAAAVHYIPATRRTP